MKTATRRTLLGIGIAVVAIVAVPLLVLSLLDWNRLKHPIERIASARSGRTVTLTGSVQGRIWTRTPSITLEGLSVANPSWEKSDLPLAQIERVQIELEALPLLRGHLILRRLELTRPRLYLHQEKSGRANWTDENNAPSSERATRPPRLPAIRDLVIDSGKLVLIDELRRLKVTGTMQAQERSGGQDAKPFRIEGTGTINEQPFKLAVSGGALQDLSPRQPYPFTLAITAGENQISADGRALKPFDLGALDLQVSASGRDLAELFYLTRITLPNTPPFKLQAHIARDGQHFSVTDIAGSLGGSDLAGSAEIDVSHKRPKVKADLLSRHLFFKDLAALTGSKAHVSASLDTRKSPPLRQPDKGSPPEDVPHFFPDAHLQVERVRAMDADVRFRATSVDAGTVPFTEVALHATLEAGLLELQPVEFDMAQGHISGTVSIDARPRVPRVRIDLRGRDIRLEQFVGRGPNALPPLDGTLQARALLEGTGDSVHNLMSDANGTLTLIVPNGDVRSKFAELTGVDVAEGIGLVLTGSNGRTPLRCGVAQFDVKDGLAHAEHIVLDTQNVLITGRGQINLAPEQLDLTLQGHPKKLRLVRLHAPVRVRGYLLKPSFGLEPGRALKQGGVAAALATVLGPLGAVLAFVDPGLAKDQNCAALLTEAKDHAALAGAPAPNASPSAAAN